jgi:hypothetical protein
VHLLHLAGPEIRAGVPVDQQEPQLIRLGPGVAAGDRQLQLRGLPGGGQLAQLAADRPDLRRPVQARQAAQRRRRDAGGTLSAL